MVDLMPHQQEAVDKLSNGKILWGGVGTGKTLTALAYYVQKDQCGDIYVITTARKRDLLEWETEAIQFGISTEAEYSLCGKLTVDSWNNIGKYVDVEGATFIFDEQRLVGTGAWVKSFLKIAKKNAWIMLSATPGDTWLDYAPVFIANGFYKNITEFKAKHVILSSYSKYPKVERYVQTSELVANKNAILLEMPYVKHTIRHLEYTEVPYDERFFKETARRRWNPFEDRPCDNYVELFRVLRRIAVCAPERLELVRELVREHKKVIIFYVNNYELEALRTLSDEVTVAEWNGKKKELIPTLGTSGILY
jgi:superfamily II DNA or RNA helicase